MHFQLRRSHVSARTVLTAAPAARASMAAATVLRTGVSSRAPTNFWSRQSSVTVMSPDAAATSTYGFACLVSSNRSDSSLAHDARPPLGRNSWDSCGERAWPGTPILSLRSKTKPFACISWTASPHGAPHAIPLNPDAVSASAPNAKDALRATRSFHEMVRIPILRAGERRSMCSSCRDQMGRIAEAISRARRHELLPAVSA